MIRSKPPPGTRPGTLVINPASPAPKIHVIAYGPDRHMETDITDPGEVSAHLGKYPVVWVNVDGLGDENVLRRMAQIFGLHRLALEDVVNVYQRPKVEPYEGHLFIVARMIHYEGHLETEQVSFFVGTNFVLTFQEYYGDCFDIIRQRIKTGQGIIRQAGPGYLAYALIDALVDAYFPVLEQFGERIEDLEDDVVSRPTSAVVARIHSMKRDLLTLRRATWPQREAVNALLRDESAFIDRETRIYLRDCYDHTIQILDIIETYRELTSGLLEVYLSSLSNRLNEIMKVLAVYATIFAPLTFITGLYGMNLMMPEQALPWAYPAVLALMGSIAALLLVHFKRRGWIGQPRRTGAREAANEAPKVPP